MKVQGITPEYVREMRKFDSNASIDDLIGMKVQGITPEYFREARKTYSNLSIEELIGMKVQGGSRRSMSANSTTWVCNRARMNSSG